MKVFVSLLGGFNRTAVGLEEIINGITHKLDS